MRRLLPLLLLFLPALAAQPPVEFFCPMDPDIRAQSPGKCSKCGMTLEAIILNLVEYPLKVRLTPPAIQPGQKIELQFQVFHPETGEPVRQFNIVHEKLFHLFLVSHDLEYFSHEHPDLGPDSIFRLQTILPKPGVYRLLCDFYPQGGAPQMIPKTLATAGATTGGAIPPADLNAKNGENLQVELATEPEQPIAGKKTLLFFRLKPAQGLEPYLGAWGHLLAASHDLIELIHTHPAIANGGPQVQFNLIFPREAVYRIWVQFQREGKVNTVAFTVPVSRLK